jgi:hypothetical protein
MNENAPSEPPDGPVEYLWLLVEASSVEAVGELWSAFAGRILELRELAKREDLNDSLWHLGRALDQNAVFDEWMLKRKRSTILSALRSCTR